MVEINGTQYKLCLLDTNVISEIIKNRQEEFQKYFNNLFHEGYIPCFSAFSIVELQKTRELFSKFLDLFTVLPSAILKGNTQILEEEIENYPHYQKINPLSVSLVGLKPYNSLTKRQTVELLFKTEPFVSLSEQHLSNRNSDLHEMIAYAQSYLTKDGKYSKIDMEVYLHITLMEWVFIKNREFINSKVKIEKDFDIRAFPSLLMMAYTMFYKFCENRLRKALQSDVFDIRISASVPYVDAFITERHQAWVINKIKEKEKEFLSDITIFNVKRPS